MAEAALALTWFEENRLAGRRMHDQDDPTAEWHRVHQRAQEMLKETCDESKLDPFTKIKEVEKFTCPLR